MVAGLVGGLLLAGVSLGWPIAERLHVSTDTALIVGVLLIGISRIEEGLRVKR